MIPDSAAGAVLLGIVQGITEWIPVSSEGAVATVYSVVFDRPVSEAVRYALWLHLGTALAALVYFRSEISALLRELITLPRRPSPLLRFVAVATVVSAVISLPVLWALDQASARFGASAMGLVGVFLVVTGVIQLRQRTRGSRERDEANDMDAALTGAAQGLAALPGLSRSGATVGVLLARGFQPRVALVLSFLLSIPASVGAALFAGVDSGLYVSRWAILAVAVAAVTGLATLRLLIGVAERINFGRFVIAAGAVIVGAAIWEAVR